MPISIHANRSESEQMSSFQNATLQGVADCAFSVAVSVAVPVDVAPAAHLNAVFAELAARPDVSIEIWIGPNAEVEDEELDPNRYVRCGACGCLEDAPEAYTVEVPADSETYHECRRCGA